MAEQPDIDVVINAKDSRETIGFAIRSVQSLAREIVVLDMESDDDTVAIARSLGARVVEIQTQPIADTTREFAIAQTSAPWILMLDADELVSPALLGVLRQIADGGEHDAVRLPMVNYLMGDALRFTSWSPHHDRHWRFFRRDAMVWPGRIHTMPQLAPGMRGIELPYETGCCLVHFNYVNTSHFLGKLDRYTDLEAERVAERGWSPIRATIAILREFAIRYLVRQGFRDGFRGLHVTVLMMIYRYLSHTKAREYQTIGRRDDVIRHYAEVAERWLASEASGA